jgi:thymidylate synthase (FAD)
MSRIGLLDHGYVELVEHWGSDERIIEAARMSTGKGFKGWESVVIDVAGAVNSVEHGTAAVTRAHLDSGLKVRRWDVEEINAGKKHVCPDGCMAAEEYALRRFSSVEIKDVRVGDERLLAFLYNNAHMTPFEMAGCIIEVQAPIFVFREWHRHRTQSYNEMSARYEPLPDVNYIPTVERLMVDAGGGNKQAGTIGNAEVLTEAHARMFQDHLSDIYKEAQGLYQIALSQGVPKELARIHLPVGRYSRMRASANLRNWMQFLTLRQATNAQFEIRVYANAVHDVLATLFPRTLALFDEKVK